MNTSTPRIFNAATEQNTGKTTAILLSADLLPVDAKDPHTM